MTTNLWMEQQVSKRLAAQLKRQDLVIGEAQLRAERAERRVAELEEKLAAAESEVEWLMEQHADYRARAEQMCHDLLEMDG